MADKSFFFRFAHRVSQESGKPHVFAAAVAVVILWAVSGPVFGFSETWQLIINTGTTIVTFLMVFLVQNTQNRDGEAIQAKLDELILVTRASNTFIGAEKLTAGELEHLRAVIAERARRAEAHDDDGPDHEARRPHPARPAGKRGAAKGRTPKSGASAAAAPKERERS